MDRRDLILKEKIVELFNELFIPSFATELVDQGVEPIYLPQAKSTSAWHQIYFAHGFWNSAFHEIAHWCIAGAKRREQVDYGYWYQPDGRTVAQQMEFESVEVKPQALEWILTSAVKRRFFLSVDNLSGGVMGPSYEFREKVRACALSQLADGMPPRMTMFLNHLLKEFRSREHFALYWKKVDQDGVLPE